MIIVLFTVTLAPLLISYSQTTQLTKNTYVHATRADLVQSLAAQMDLNRADYALFNDSTMQTSVSESGEVIPYYRAIDFTNSTVFDKILHLYIYRDAGDALSNPLSRSTVRQSVDAFRINCGGDNYVDQRGRFWIADTAEYNGTTVLHGFVSGFTGSTATRAGNVLNTTMDPLYESYRQSATSIRYNFKVTNGQYRVNLYFAEMSPTVTLSNHAIINILLEGQQRNGSGYSVFTETGDSTLRANIQSYQTDVADNLLNLEIERDASSPGSNGYINGIEIIML